MSARAGRIMVRLAMSLDGYIADAEGGFDWIRPVPSPSLDTEHQLPFEDFVAGVDLVVMGRHCFDQRQHLDYLACGKKVVVATATPSLLERREKGVTFVGPHVVDVVKGHRDQGRHCFIFGGGKLLQSFLAADAVDILTVGIVPTLLGGGRPLFHGGHPPLDLKLVDYTVQDGKTRLVYERRTSPQGAL